MKVFDFKCPNGHVTEAFVKYATDAKIQCDCGEVAKRMPAAPRVSLEGCSGDFPGAAMRWESKRAEKQRIQERKLADHGDDCWT